MAIEKGEMSIGRKERHIKRSQIGFAFRRRNSNKLEWSPKRSVNFVADHGGIIAVLRASDKNFVEVHFYEIWTS